MRITPVDIRNQKFVKSFRGYNPSEVDGFLEVVSSTLEELLVENNELKERMLKAESTLKGYVDLESSLKDALITAQKASEEIRENAQKEAELLMRETRLKAERNMEETYEALSRMKKQIADLENLRTEYVARFRSLLDTYRNVMESMEREDQPYKEEPQPAGDQSRSQPSPDEEIQI